MRIAIPQFPGSNCDQDALWALRDDLGVQADYVWHDEPSLAGFDGVFVPGGFTYGDYLRCGAIASRSPIMLAVQAFAESGRPVLGVCNGFQILCECGLLPGALVRNAGQKFLCRDVFLHSVNRSSEWTRECPKPLRVPIAHGEGRYVADPGTLAQLRAADRIAFVYGPPAQDEAAAGIGQTGSGEDRWNPNGSAEAIAGILNERGNVLGMMPHPERATKALLGSTDGLAILKGFLAFGRVPAEQPSATVGV